MAKMAQHSRQVHEWSESDVRGWVERVDVKLAAYGEVFETHNIDGRTLLTITESDLREAPLSISKLGDIKRLHAAIRCLQTDAGVRVTKRSRGPSVGRARTVSPASDTEEEESEVDERIEARLRKRDLKRLVLASMYCGVSVFATSFSLVTAHERVPLTDQYPPLPDLLLDNFPRMPWAFAASEYALFSLAGVLLVLVMAHRSRIVISTRFFAIAATVFLLRCVTMLVTSLSVPGEHLECPPLQLNSFEEKVERALKIVLGLGTTVLGVETCGDYMFSGHCVGLTLMACFIGEYSPPSWVVFHRVVWCVAISGMACILLAHEHYSIDVFVGFYISSRVFAYHHMIVSAMATMSRQQVKKMNLWFPLVAFFEREQPLDHHTGYEFPRFLRKM